MLLLLCVSSAVLQAQQILCQSQKFQFVEIGATARIPCIAADIIEDEGLLLSWFKSREGGMLVPIKSCDDGTSQGKFVCGKEGRRSFVLEISNVQRNDSGFYLCANHGARSFIGSSLIVGDSYTPNSQVMLLHPTAYPAPQTLQSVHLACVVLEVSNLVQVTWDVPGGLRQDGQTLLVRNSSSSLTFISHLRVPAVSWMNGEPYACKVQFNSSGTSIKMITFSHATLNDADHCLNHKVPLAVLGVLVSMLFLTSCLWGRRCTAKHGFQDQVSRAPSSEEPQENVSYAELHFPLRTQDRTRRR